MYTEIVIYTIEREVFIMKKLATIAVMMLCLFVMAGCSNNTNSKDDTNNENTPVNGTIVYETTKLEPQEDALPTGTMTVEVNVKNDYVQSITFLHTTSLTEQNTTKEEYEETWEFLHGDFSFSNEKKEYKISEDGTIVETFSYSLEDVYINNFVLGNLSINEDDFEVDENGKASLKFSTLDKYLTKEPYSEGYVLERKS